MSPDVRGVTGAAAARAGGEGPVGVQADWPATFDAVFAAPASTVERSIWQEVFGDEYPSEASPYSFVTRSELREVVAGLALVPGDVLLDVGCGRGGPGRWVAAQARAMLVGLDVSAVAVAQAAGHVRDGPLRATAYVVGGVEALPLAAGSMRGVMSIDALAYATDQRAAVCELARVLAPGGRLVATTWDFHAPPPGRPPQVDDHRPLLEAVGLEVRRYEETVAWEARERRLHELLVDRAAELALESGEPVEDVHAGLDDMAATIDATRRRVLLVASKPPSA